MKPYEFIFDMLSFKQKVGGGKGKVMRIKKGYNPNSSSIGTIVFTIPVMFLGLFTFFGTLLSVLFSLFINKRKKEGRVDAQ